MHMADALLSPAVGGIMWAGSVAAIGYSSKKLRENMDSKTIPLMGVMGAFIFAVQMVNFTIPGTGSSGHLGGGMILAILLGPCAAFLVMASILTVQALFFADGGLLALGCNIWNLGIYPCFLAYPVIYRPIARSGANIRRTSLAAIAGVIVALQLGAFSVVLETFLSGKSELPFGTFLLFMLPIHLAIGLVEGFVTAGILRYVKKVRPEILNANTIPQPLQAGASIRNIVIVFAALTVITGGALSWFASTHPDGLEWSVRKITGKDEPAQTAGGPAPVLRKIQEKTAILPDYNFKAPPRKTTGEETAAAWPALEAGTSISGIIGGAVVLVLVTLIAYGIRFARKLKL
jgi:cobalt/nickel transport system permease protein